MLNVCTLTPDQWALVHQHPPKGTTSSQPEGYHRAGLYEARFENQDTIILIQRANGDGYRFWLFSDLFTLPVSTAGLEEAFEVAEQARRQAADLREKAEQLLIEADHFEQIANDALNEAFIPNAHHEKDQHAPVRGALAEMKGK